MMIKNARSFSDQNFLNICAVEDGVKVVYTVPLNAPENWGCISVGTIVSGYGPLTEADIDRYFDQCEPEYGNYELPDEEEEVYEEEEYEEDEY